MGHMMETENATRVQKMNPEDVLSFVREHEDPAVTATEVAEAFAVTSRAANYRLNQLEDRGKVRSKDVGASAKIWYVCG